MNQNLFLTPFSSLINLFLITSFLLARKSICIDPQFLACNPKTCGDGQNITFPFYIEGEQDSFCGYPRFNVSCQNSHPILRSETNNYIIHQISYESQTIRVSNAAVFNTTNTCIPPFQNTSFSPNDMLQLYANQRDIVLLYHCDSSRIGGDNSELSKYKVDCSNDGGSNLTLSMFEDDPLLGYASSVCENAVVTAVDVEREGESSEIQRMLERGFLLNWVASDCSECQISGGKCGFDFSIFHFRCFCPDRPHSWHCLSVSDGMTMTIPVTTTAAGILILAIIILCYLRRKFLSDNILCWQKRTQDYQNIEAFLRSHGQLALKRYKYSQVKKLTGSFKEKLGQGGYGDVFKGELPNGCLVAVKLLEESKSNGEEFINEVASISRTSHVNIVSLLGFCFEGSKRALIYEFITNGSLEKYVRKQNALEPNHQLGWETLFNIAVGVARGLDYLHRGCNTRILHFDIKPHNILLDENFCPKISDFGLAKICTKRESIVSMIEARGTIGYIAPEIFCRNFGGVSHKSDVYSYGMLVLDIVGGRQNTCAEVDNSSEMYFPDWIYKNLIGDEEVGVFGINNEVENQIAKKLILVSLWCIQAIPSNRPPMCRVVEMLQGSLQSLPIPPKPCISSPSRSRSFLQSVADSSTTITTRTD